MPPWKRDEVRVLLDLKRHLELKFRYLIYVFIERTDGCQLHVRHICGRHESVFLYRNRYGSIRTPQFRGSRQNWQGTAYVFKVTIIDSERFPNHEYASNISLDGFRRRPTPEVEHLVARKSRQESANNFTLILTSLIRLVTPRLSESRKGSVESVKCFKCVN